MNLKVIRTCILLFSLFVAYLAYATLYSHAIIQDKQTGRIIFGYDQATGKFYLNEYQLALKSLDGPQVFNKRNEAVITSCGPYPCTCPCGLQQPTDANSCATPRTY